MSKFTVHHKRWYYKFLKKKRQEQAIIQFFVDKYEDEIIKEAEERLRQELIYGIKYKEKK